MSDTAIGRSFSVGGLAARGTLGDAAPNETLGEPSQVSLQAERARIASVLHDAVLQTFGVCLLKAQICDRFLQLGANEKASEELGILQERLGQAIDQIRELLTELKKP